VVSVVTIAADLQTRTLSHLYVRKDEIEWRSDRSLASIGAARYVMRLWKRPRPPGVIRPSTEHGAGRGRVFEVALSALLKQRAAVQPEARIRASLRLSRAVAARRLNALASAAFSARSNLAPPSPIRASSVARATSVRAVLAQLSRPRRHVERANSARTSLDTVMRSVAGSLSL
jgi:hypothetical protein